MTKKLTQRTKELMGIKGNEASSIASKAPKAYDLSEKVLEEISNLRAYLSQIYKYVKSGENDADPQYAAIKKAYDEALDFSNSEIMDMVSGGDVIHLIAFIQMFHNTLNI